MGRLPYDGNIDAQGVIVGKPTLEKLDKFFDLANASYQPMGSDQAINLPNSALENRDGNYTQASAILDDLNIHLSDNVADELDNWFAESEAIRLQA